MVGRNLLIAAITVFIVLGGIYLVREPLQSSVYSYLSLNRPEKAEVLVIEGWLGNRMFKEAAAEFWRGKYSLCLVIGKTRSSRSPIRVLIGFGVDSVAVKFADAETKKGHSTYHIAIAARQWLQTNYPEISTLNVFTAGPHGRKSWILFKRVFGPDYSVGVVSCSIERSDDEQWSGRKQKLRTLIKYVTGYFYAMVWPFEK